MRYTKLASTGQSISVIGAGCWQLGGKGWGTSREADTLGAVRRAIELGVNLFDTAPIYGFGRSEELLGRLLRTSPRDAVVVSKGGLVWDARQRVRHDNRPRELRRQLEATLRRLRREVVDVYLLHWPDPEVPFEDAATALEDFRDRGLIRGWGASNFPVEEVVRGVGLRPSDEGRCPVLESPVNLLDIDHALVALETPVARGWDILAYDVLARGLLAGGYDLSTRFGKRDVRRRDPRFQGDALAANLRRIDRLKEAARALGTSPATLAIRGVLERPEITACLVGSKHPRQTEENVRAADLALPAALDLAL